MQDIKKLQRYKIFYHRALLDDAMPFWKNPTDTDLLQLL